MRTKNRATELAIFSAGVDNGKSESCQEFRHFSKEYMMVEHVHGRDAGHVMLYALSTCGWCRKTRQLLEELGVAYDYEYVDLLAGDQRARVMSEVSRWNPVQTFPTVVVNNDKVIVGFREDEIRKALNA